MSYVVTNRNPALAPAPGAEHRSALETWKAHAQAIVDRRLAQGATLEEALQAASGPIRAALRARDLREREIRALTFLADAQSAPEKPTRRRRRRSRGRGRLSHGPRIDADVMSTFAAA